MCEDCVYTGICLRAEPFCFSIIQYTFGIYIQDWRQDGSKIRLPINHFTSLFNNDLMI